MHHVGYVATSQLPKRRSLNAEHLDPRAKTRILTSEILLEGRETSKCILLQNVTYYALCSFICCFVADIQLPSLVGLIRLVNRNIALSLI